MERAMAGIKGKKSDGGISFHKPMMKAEYEQEQSIMKITFADSKECFLPANSNGCYERNEDGSAVSYNDLAFALLKYRGSPEGEKIDINTYQTQNLLDFLLMEMNALWTPEVLATSSPLFRLNKTYLIFKNQHNNKSSNTKFMTLLSWLYNTSDRIASMRFSIMLTDKMPSEDTDYKFIYRDDVSAITFWTKPHLRVFNEAMIWGSRYSSRGHDCCETRLLPKASRSYGQEPTVAMSNEANVLATEFYKHTTSWCKLYDRGMPTTTSSAHHAFAVAQINYFTTLPDEANESLLTGLPFASITARKHKKIYRKNFAKDKKDEAYYENLFEVSCNENESFDHSRHYCMLYNIYATPLAVAAYDNDGHPIEKVKQHQDPNPKSKFLVLHAVAREKEIIHNNPKCRAYMLPYNNMAALGKVKVELNFR
jgi:hypothetical protein